MEQNQTAYNQKEGWISITEGFQILKETLKRRQLENRDYEHHPNVHAFYEYLKIFKENVSDAQLNEKRKELRRITENFKRVPERDTIQIWNLIPQNEDEAKSFIKELETCPDSPIRRAVDYLNE